MYDALRFCGNYSSRLQKSSTARTEDNSEIVLIFCRRLAVRDIAGMLANFSFFYLCSFTPLSFPGEKKVVALVDSSFI